MQPGSRTSTAGPTPPPSSPAQSAGYIASQSTDSWVTGAVAVIVALGSETVLSGTLRALYSAVGGRWLAVRIRVLWIPLFAVLDGQATHGEPSRAEAHDRANLEIFSDRGEVCDQQRQVGRRGEFADSSELHRGGTRCARDGEHRCEVAVHGHHDEIVRLGVPDDRCVARSQKIDVANVQRLESCVAEPVDEGRGQVGVEEQPHAGRETGSSRSSAIAAA